MLEPSLAASVVGLVIHLVGMSSYFVFRPAATRRPEVARILGPLTWLTWQTHVLCCAWFVAAIALILQPSWQALGQVVLSTFPLVFSLAFCVTILFYALEFEWHRTCCAAAARQDSSASSLPADHVWLEDRPAFSPVARVCKAFSRVRCCSRAAVLDHVEHSLALPAALLSATTLRATVAPRDAEVVLPIVGFGLWYALLLIANHTATRAWPYGLLGLASSKLGVPGGILLVTAAMCAVFVACGYAGAQLLTVVGSSNVSLSSSDPL